MKVLRKGDKLNLGISISIGVLFFIIGISIYFTQLRALDSRARLEIAEKYLTIQQRVEYLLIDNVSLIRGLTAYVEMNDDYRNEEVMELLEILYADRLEEVRNVGIVQDTTMRWVYPLEGNETVLGVDLAKIEGQKDGVLAVKNTLETKMFGPVDLVQGGQGFIIRIPILKEDRYWGLGSVVLNADYIFEIIRNFEETQNVSILVTYPNTETNIIYGEESILMESPIKFSAKESNVFLWDMYIIPKDGWFNSTIYTLIIFVLMFILSVYVSRKIYGILSDFVSMEIHRDEMVKISNTDPFTGIANRGFLNQFIIDEIIRSDRTLQSISMIYFDLDYFKYINDTYGHAQGDAVLTAVVGAVNSVIRINDFFARWGGDEFVVLLPHTDLSGAATVAEKVRYAIENLKFEHGYKITASLGVSERVHLEFAESWFKRTDKALYKSKNLGRNRVTSSNHFNENILRKIIWLDKWNCGIYEIDSAHLHATELCNELVISSFDEDRYDITVRLAGELLKDIGSHFSYEVKYLKQIHYPDALNHEAIHNNLLSLTEALYLKLIEKKVSSEELLTFLRDSVVVGHLVNVDQRYREYM